MAENVVNTTGGVAVLNGGMALPKFAFVSVAAAATDTAVVAAVSGKKIRVLDVKISTVTAATAITFNSKPSGAGTAISCAFNALVGVVAFGFNPLGHFETASGEGLSATTGIGNAVGVQVTYIEV